MAVNKKNLEDKCLYLILNKCHCDLYCIFCSRGLKSHQEKLKSELKDFDYRSESRRLQEIIMTNYDKGIRHIIIGGNEPLNHPHILKIIGFAKKTGYERIELATAGLRFSNEDYVKRVKLAGLTHAILPVYGTDKEVHDSVVRVKGAFRLFQKAINNLIKNKIYVGVHSVVMKQNINEITALRKKYKRVGIAYPMPFPNQRNYADIAIKISSLPQYLRVICFPNIPCINNNKKQKLDIELRFKTDDTKNIAIDLQKDNTVKMSKCKSCKRKDDCGGIWPEYINIFGEDDFKPI